MPEEFIGSCTTALKNLISADDIKTSATPYSDFSEGIKNFHKHYCLDDHTSRWCHHPKVHKCTQKKQISNYTM